MKKILLLVGLVLALAVPSTASASEPAEWYIGDLPAEGAVVNTNIVGGWFEIDQPSWKWDFRCDANHGTLGSWGIEARALFTCDNSSPKCDNFTAEISSNGAPLVASKENGVSMVDTSNSKIIVRFETGEGYGKGSCVGLGKSSSFSGNPLHGTWKNLTPTIGQVDFVNVWTTAGTLNGSLFVEGDEGYYYDEVGSEEYEEVWGVIPVSIR